MLDLWTTLLLGVVFVACIFYWSYRSKRLPGLDNKPVLITGCDMGLGHDLAVELCRMNIPVFASCLSEKSAEMLKETVANLPGSDKFYTPVLDVRSQQQMQKVYDFVSEKVKETGLWGVVCNAGILGTPVIDDWLTPENYDETLSVNVIGAIRTCQMFKPLMLPFKRGRLVFISSFLGTFSAPAIGPYVVSKYALEGYSAVLRHELNNLGVSVLTVCPFFFTTNLTARNRVVDLVQRGWEQAKPIMRRLYGEKYRERLKDILNNGLMGQCASSAAHVVDSCVHALTAVNPKMRYNVGLEANFFSWLGTLPSDVHQLFINGWYRCHNVEFPQYLAEADWDPVKAIEEYSQ